MIIDWSRLEVYLLGDFADIIVWPAFGSPPPAPNPPLPVTGNSTGISVYHDHDYIFGTQVSRGPVQRGYI